MDERRSAATLMASIFSVHNDPQIYYSNHHIARSMECFGKSIRYEFESSSYVALVITAIDEKMKPSSFQLFCEDGGDIRFSFSRWM